MQDDEQRSESEPREWSIRGFLVGLFRDLIRDAVRFIIAFALGTGAGALVCGYYGIPLIFALLGGILVLGLALALSSDSLFS